MARLPLTDSLRTEYQRLFDTCTADPDRQAEIDAALKRILAAADRYRAVAGRTRVPWPVVALLHTMECGGRFDQHLHNGDPLTGRTVHVPAGRPPSGEPPFAWEDSAEDALVFDGMAAWSDWSLPGTLYKMEGYNGFGYRLRHPEVLTPYLWAGSQHYSAGKFVADGQWSATAVSRQIGAAVLLKGLLAAGASLDMPVRLNVATAAEPAAEPVAAEWTAQSYPIAAARGADAPLLPLELPADTVLELTLADGTRLLTAAGDAQQYLGVPERGAAAPGLCVGQSLRPDASLDLAASRAGLGSWILSALKVYRSGPAAMTVLAAAGAFQDAQLENRCGLYRCATAAWGLSPAGNLAADGGPILLFLHGTGSSTWGSFAGLWQEPFRRQLAAAYGERAYAFEHRSITESPIANALDLARALPAGAVLHLVSHSRGGMVGELLARANRRGDAFSEAEIGAFLEYAKRIGREGMEADAQRLRELNRELAAKRLRVERFVRVAGPMRGTTLASGRLDRWATVMLNLAQKGLGLIAPAVPGGAVAAKALELLNAFLLAIVRERTDARLLPGLEAVMPESPLVSLLNGPGVEVEGAVHVLAGDYQGEGLLARLGDWLSESFYGGATDLVVNTPSMAGGAARSEGVYQLALRGPEVTHFSYFRRAESAGPLLDALAGKSDAYQRLAAPSRAPIARGGREDLPKADAPIVLLLPGIMGSNLQVGTDRIWFDPLSLWTGGIGQVAWGTPNVTPDGWFFWYYDELARHLAQTHEVRPFPFDWRASIKAEAARFGALLDQALADGKARGRPVHILAHSMGGLVARLALKERWPAFKALPGSRLLQLGTPNGGSHAMAAVLLGRDDFVHMIETWFDLRYDMREFLGFVKDFPGVLEMLPWPGANELAGDGVDYFAAATWNAWQAGDATAGSGAGWQAPLAGPLAEARAVAAELAAAPVDPECSLYVAGCAEATPVAVRLENDDMCINVVAEGDGRVPWKTGIPAGVRAWYAAAAHGDLPRHQEAFAAYTELLLSGRTALLPETPAGARGAAPAAGRYGERPRVVLHPTADELLAAAMGGRRPAAAAAPAEKVVVDAVHGSLVNAEAQVIIGTYAGDSLRGSAKFLDQRLNGALARAQRLGRYPAKPGDAAVFAVPGSRPEGAIVIGLGAVGGLTLGELARAYAQGLLEYARQQEGCATGPSRLAVASLLVGTGYGGVSIASSVRALLEALRQANATLAAGRCRVRIGRLTFFEVAEDRAVAAAEALEKLTAERRYRDVAAFSGRLRDGVGGYRRRLIGDDGADGWYRVQIAEEDGGLRFTLVGERARNEVLQQPDQRQAVDGLIAAATGGTDDQACLSRALFELLVPNAMKELVAEVNGVMLAVDPAAAAYPWELMRDEAQAGEPPLAARVGLVRQLATPRGRGAVPTVKNRRAFVVGDTASGYAELPAAQAEGDAVGKALAVGGFEVVARTRPAAGEVFCNLFDGEYAVIHLAGHGVVDFPVDGDKFTGMVLGPKTFLTPAQVSKLRHPPEFVFINCCHLGAMAPEAAAPNYARLAANLAAEFIEIGCKAVIAAGWAVDDQAAGTFARRFYDAMLGGERFGEAVRLAREEAYNASPASNTWGAYQAYGDERYRFPTAGRSRRPAPDYRHVNQLLAGLDRLHAEVPGAEGDDLQALARRADDIEQAVRGRFFDRAEVREKLGAIRADLGDLPAAIEHYRAATAQEDGRMSLHALEQLAKLEGRWGAGRADGEPWLDASRRRLEMLVALAPTAERHSLFGNHWKHVARRCRQGKGKAREMRDLLARMTEAYGAAWRESEQRSGEADYYPLHNALDGAWLLKAWGVERPYAELLPRLPALLAAGQRNARRRQAEAPATFHRVAEAHGALIAGLWAAAAGPREQAITEPAVRQAVATAYRQALLGRATAREKAAVLSHLEALAELLPDNQGKLRQALETVADGLRG